jgi:hypothetical protein
MRPNFSLGDFQRGSAIVGMLRFRIVSLCETSTPLRMTSHLEYVESCLDMHGSIVDGLQFSVKVVRHKMGKWAVEKNTGTPMVSFVRKVPTSGKTGQKWGTRCTV